MFKKIKGLFETYENNGLIMDRKCITINGEMFGYNCDLIVYPKASVAKEVKLGDKAIPYGYTVVDIVHPMFQRDGYVVAAPF